MVYVSHMVYLVEFTDMDVLGPFDFGPSWSFAAWAVLAHVGWANIGYVVLS